MNKTELVQRVARRASLSENKVNEAVSAIFDSIGTALTRGERVNLVGFGTFEVMDRAARTGRNPQTGRAISIPAAKTAKFRPGKHLKAAVS